MKKSRAAAEKQCGRRECPFTFREKKGARDGRDQEGGKGEEEGEESIASRIGFSKKQTLVELSRGTELRKGEK